jgi:hypothetical protein
MKKSGRNCCKNYSCEFFVQAQINSFSVWVVLVVGFRGESNAFQDGMKCEDSFKTLKFLSEPAVLQQGSNSPVQWRRSENNKAGIAPALFEPVGNFRT